MIAWKCEKVDLRDKLAGSPHVYLFPMAHRLICRSFIPKQTEVFARERGEGARWGQKISETPAFASPEHNTSLIGRHHVFMSQQSASVRHAAIAFLQLVSSCQRLCLSPRALWLWTAGLRETDQRPRVAAALRKPLTFSKGQTLMDVHGRYKTSYPPLVTQCQEPNSVPALIWNKHPAFQQWDDEATIILLRFVPRRQWLNFVGWLGV